MRPSATGEEGCRGRESGAGELEAGTRIGRQSLYDVGKKEKKSKSVILLRYNGLLALENESQKRRGGRRRRKRGGSVPIVPRTRHQA
jgi:hypothetical protein